MEQETFRATLKIEGMGAHPFLPPVWGLNPYRRTICTDFQDC